ncbi:MAG: hypothetical protein KKD86_05400 [Bacteroidetes bacterium]|nr:hypothetical protein [Bacteroidota bacterium]MBU1678277.1 hypothetical protein [Bacteroidota bacterium]
MEKYIKAIRENICSICVDSSEEGECTLTNQEICAVENYLPKIIEIIHGSNGDNFDEIYSKLREDICEECYAKSEDGECYLREDKNCSLDRYFPLIIEVVQKVDAGKL